MSTETKPENGNKPISPTTICSALRRWMRKEWHNFWYKDQAMCGRCGNIVQANGASWRWHGVACHFPDQCPKCGWPNVKTVATGDTNEEKDA
jgi:hypothetical protein